MLTPHDQPWKPLQSLLTGGNGPVRARASFRAFRWRGHSAHRAAGIDPWCDSGEARCSDCKGLWREHGYTRSKSIVCFGDWVVVGKNFTDAFKSLDFFEHFEATAEALP